MIKKIKTFILNQCNSYNKMKILNKNWEFIFIIFDLGSNSIIWKCVNFLNWKYHFLRLCISCADFELSSPLHESKFNLETEGLLCSLLCTTVLSRPLLFCSVLSCYVCSVILYSDFYRWRIIWDNIKIIKVIIL